MITVFLIVMTLATFTGMLICIRKVFEFQSERKKKANRKKFYIGNIHEPKPEKEISIWEEDLRIRQVTFVDEKELCKN